MPTLQKWPIMQAPLFTDESTKSLFAGLFNSDLSQCAAALDAGADPNARDPSDFGETALTRAIERRFLDGVELLLGRGATTDISLPSTTLPLHYAAHRGDAAACRMLLASGANVNMRDAHGRTALHRATIGGDAKACQELIAGGADVRIVNSSGNTPLHTAAMGDFPDTVTILRALVAAGVDPDHVPLNHSRSYESPFQLAVRIGRARSVHFFLSECAVDPEQVNGDGFTMLELTTNADTAAVLRAALAEKAIAARVGAAFDSRNVEQIQRPAPSPL
jgi:ankyrin repeat protein